MKRRLTSVSPLKLGITLGVIYGILSLIIAVPLFLIFSMVGAASAARGGGPALPALFSGVFIVFLPFIYAVLGFVAGVIMAFVYNVVAKWTGGVEFTTEEAA